MEQDIIKFKKRIIELSNLKRKDIEKLGRELGLDLRNSNYQCSSQPSYDGGYTKINAIVDLAYEELRGEKLRWNKKI